MTTKSLAVASLLALAAYLLLFLGMAKRGLVGPDEPRYASIARQMAESGDWVTPRLDGEPWFEKPALLYWLGAATELLGAPLGLAGDLATRVPVALISLLFLSFYYRLLSDVFEVRTAAYATAILGTSAGWVVYSQVGVVDLPLTAALAAALLVLLPWVQRADQQTRRALPVFGALLGVSVLAKGLVGPALAALALLAVCWERGLRPAARDLLHWRTWAPFGVVALPWYVICYARNGSSFLWEFFWRHHLERFSSASIQHVEPIWYFVPVLLGALLPWTPLLALLPGREQLRDPRFRFLLVWAATTFAFFSLSTNKLPGYILPALSPLAVLMGAGLASRRKIVTPLVAAALMLALLPLVEAVLPQALADGLGKAWPPQELSWTWGLTGLLAASAVDWAAASGRRSASVALLLAFSAISLAQLKIRAFPLIDRQAGARPLWLQIEPQLNQTCLGDVRRHVAYGLRYYSHNRLPDCSHHPRPFRVESDPAVLTGPTALP